MSLHPGLPCSSRQRLACFPPASMPTQAPRKSAAPRVGSLGRSLPFRALSPQVGAQGSLKLSHGGRVMLLVWLLLVFSVEGLVGMNVSTKSSIPAESVGTDFLPVSLLCKYISVMGSSLLSPCPQPTVLQPLGLPGARPFVGLQAVPAEMGLGQDLLAPLPLHLDPEGPRQKPCRSAVS